MQLLSLMCFGRAWRFDYQSNTRTNLNAPSSPVEEGAKYLAVCWEICHVDTHNSFWSSSINPGYFVLETELSNVFLVNKISRIEVTTVGSYEKPFLAWVGNASAFFDKLSHGDKLLFMENMCKKFKSCFWCPKNSERISWLKLSQFMH